MVEVSKERFMEMAMAESDYVLLKSKYDDLRQAYTNAMEDKEKWLMMCRKYENESLWDFIKRKIKKGA